MKKKIIIIIIIAIMILGGVGGFLLYQYTELFGKKLIPLKIQSIEIQYIPGYDLGTGEQFNTEGKNVVEVQNISLKGSELNSFKKELKKIKKSTTKNEELYSIQYRIVLNKKTIIKVGNEVGDIQKGKNFTPLVIPKSTLSEIEKIVDKNNKKALTKITTENVTAKLDGASITIKNKNNLNYIYDYLSYYPIQITEDYTKYEGGYKTTLILDNNTKVYLYNDHIGYISQKEGEQDTSTYGIFTKNLYELIQDIYKVSTE